MRLLMASPKAPSDYAAIASTLLTFNPGQTSKTIAVTINGDADILSRTRRSVRDSVESGKCDYQ